MSKGSEGAAPCYRKAAHSRKREHRVPTSKARAARLQCHSRTAKRSRRGGQKGGGAKIECNLADLRTLAFSWARWVPLEVFANKTDMT